MKKSCKFNPHFSSRHPFLCYFFLEFIPLQGLLIQYVLFQGLFVQYVLRQGLFALFVALLGLQIFNFKLFNHFDGFFQSAKFFLGFHLPGSYILEPTGLPYFRHILDSFVNFLIGTSIRSRVFVVGIHDFVTFFILMNAFGN